VTAAQREARTRALAAARAAGLNDLPYGIRSRVDVSEDGCWLWCGTILSGGYGQVHYAGRRHLVHRFAYQLLRGDPPSGVTLDHRCHTKACSDTGADCLHRRCVNPAHMEPMSRGDNAARFNREKETCPRGHVYDHADRRGWRKCSTCLNAAKRERRRRRQEASR
jgi:hypothetical protein